MFYSFLHLILSFVIGNSQCKAMVNTVLYLLSCLQVKLLIHLLWLLSIWLFVYIISLNPLDSVESHCSLWCLCLHVDIPALYILVIAQVYAAVCTLQ